MRLALLLATIASCLPPVARERPCRPLPLPDASVFEACGGMIYHAAPGSSAEYTIKLIDGAGPSFKLIDACVLLDGAPVFTKHEVDAFVADSKHGPATWVGKLENVRHAVQVRAVYALSQKEAPDPTKTYEVVLTGAIEVAAADGAHLDWTVHEIGDAKKPPSQRLVLEATLPTGTAKPRCE